MPKRTPLTRYEFLTDPTRDQAGRILDLYKEAGWWDGDDDPGQVAGIVRGSHCFLTAVENGRIIGMGRAISDGVSDAYIQDVKVRGDCNGKGIGSELVRRLVDRLVKDHIFWIGLIAEKNSHPFYTRMGFVPMKDAVPLLFRPAEKT